MTTMENINAPAASAGQDFRQLLLPEQRSVWFHHQLAPESALYNVAWRFHLNGPLQLEALVEAIDFTVIRNIAFRAYAIVADGVPSLEFLALSGTVTQILDVSSHARAVAEQSADSFATELASKPFNLAGDLLLRAGLVRFSGTNYQFILVTHHFAIDGLSFREFLMEEISRLYGAIIRTEKIPDPPPNPFPSALACLYEGDSVSHRTYWRNLLRDAPPGLALGKRLDTYNASAFDGEIYQAYVSRDIVDRLRVLCREERVTLFAGLLTAFQIVLHQVGKQNDLVLGVAASVRTDVVLEQAIGPFANTLPLRSTMEPGVTFRAALRGTVQVLGEALSHQTVPFDEIVAIAAPPRDNGIHPLVQVLCVFHNQQPGDNLILPGVAVKGEAIHLKTARFDLTLDASVSAEGLAITLEYATARLTPGLVRTIADGLIQVIKCAAGPDASLGAMNDISEFNQHRSRASVFGPVLPTFEAPYYLLHSGLGKYAATHPDAPAVIDSRRTLSYGELDRASARLAHRLNKLQANRGAPIAVVMRKGWEQIVAVLAILRSAAPYVPLDPSWPQARVLALLKRAEAKICFVEPGIEESIVWPADLVRLHVCPSELTQPRQIDVELPPATADPDDLAYVMFTSGSTGEPKGVMITHRSAANTVTAVNDLIGACSDDRWLSLAPLSFDLSVYDIFGALAVGGAIVFPEAPHAKDPAHWITRVCETRVTIINTVPALMGAFVEYARGCTSDVFDVLRTILLSGDRVPPELIGALCDEFCAGRVIALGGSTEASIWTTVYTVQPSDTERKSIPYGRALPNQAAIVLDAHLEPAPIGTPGDLYFAGAGLGKGYWRDPARTAQAYIIHPDTGEHLYRTGDRALLSHNGVIEFLGRADRQVKIRGHRVEPGEVEAALRTCPGIRDACVIVSTSKEGSNLIAYVVGVIRDDGALARVTREAMHHRVPNYMLPTAIIPVAGIPLTANGKSDFVALPAPKEVFPAPNEVPSTDMEHTIMEAWSVVLDGKSVGIQDRFFDVGGTSLSLLRVRARLERALGREISVSDLFAHPTIESLADHLSSISTANRVFKNNGRRRRPRREQPGAFREGDDD